MSNKANYANWKGVKGVTLNQSKEKDTLWGGKDICLDSKGYLYHAGYTGANLFTDLKGMHDLFLMKYKLNL